MSSDSFRKEKTNEYKKLSLTLLAITFIVAVFLAAVNYFTAPKIEEINREKLKDAMSAVLPQGKEFEDITTQIKDWKEETPILSMTRAIDSEGNIVGYCVEVAPKGYSAEIDMIVGLDVEGRVINTKIISISDTPGIGTQVEDKSFWGQFVGKSEIVAVKGDVNNENEIALISGATYSSSGYTNGVKAAFKAFEMVTGGAK